MSLRDWASQLEVSNVADRFSGSAGERELVKEQIKLGKSPVEIESQDRVERRAEHLGVKEEAASEFARDVKSAAGTREARAKPRPRNPGLERIIEGDDLLASVFLERGAEYSKSVCCIRESSVRIGTGFLVAPRVLMTNAHVISSKQAAEICEAEFNFEDKFVGNGTEESSVFKLAPQELFISSPQDDLDYTLVAVEPVCGEVKLETFGFLKLDPAVGKVLRGERLNIIQHPNGAPKRVALRQNRFTALLERFMHYEADTLPGSSGAPVFNDQWQVVCLHHAGVPLKDSQGRILTKDNRVWDEDDDPVLIKWIGNEGVRISRIIADVARRAGSKRSRLLAGFPQPVDHPPNEDEQLTGRKNIPVTPQSRSLSGKNSGWQDSGSRDSDSIMATSAGAITIPLTITVSADQASGGVRISLAGPHDRAVEPTDLSHATGEPRSLMERGLKNLERSQTRTYYDKRKDDQDREAYYQGIDSESDALSDELQSLVTETHTTRLAYKVARIEHLYAWVDLQRDKKVRSIYSDERFDPKKFIKEDFTIERRLESLIEKRRSREGITSEAALERMLAALEAQEPFNCEHVVPQSWFDNAAPMQGDLHHLFACQNQCNSFRGNHAYNDFGKFSITPEEAVRPRCGFSDDGLFEPFMGKGKVARATLYFLIRYPGKFDNLYEDLEDGLATLLDWHQRSPVTEHERHRNQAIFEIQGNRNPFIDHPDWANLVYGS